MRKDSRGGKRLVGSALVFALLAGCVTIGPSADVTESPKGTPDPSAGAVVATLVAVAADATKKPRRTRRPQTQPPATTAPTAPPTDAPTSAPTDTPTAATPTDTPAPAATSGGLFSFRVPPNLFPSGLVLQPLQPTLDYTAAPNYGEANLSAGFAPDPYGVSITAGGAVDVSYLGGSCTGFATSSPDLRINFGGGGAALLRLYFVSPTGDSTIVINDPYGNFYCVDDSFGTVNPTIDFNNPSGGSYDVWVGSYAAGTPVSGNFYITASSGNHP